jgi:hypothetical protein
MKATTISLNTREANFTRHAPKVLLAAVLAVLISLSWDVAISRAQQPDNDEPGAQVLTRGPVHEAFAGIVTFNAEAGVVVTKAPPEIIEELPPDERPEGDNITWIPGYWGWDDERSDFLWVSGTWRTLPPGREWMAGYWAKSAQGYQWTSGYWADAAVRETTYLPPPPATVEVGPNIAAPSVDYGWSPGCWTWYEGRYAWRPGYWAKGRADWDWTPAHYVWTPRGYIFVGGFWDYPVERRGILFAPVYFESGFYARRGYHYSPSIVIDLGVFTDHLFLRPHYHHYYFGDYYAPSYHRGGFYASFSFQSGRHGYDPIYSHHRWQHRQDREWGRRVETSYQNRRDNENARPPRTWADQRRISSRPAESRESRVVVATTINVMAKRTDSPVRFQTVAKEERQKISQRGREVQTSRDERRTLEAQAVSATARTPGTVVAPAKVQTPRSPIVGKQAKQFAKNQAPPAAQRAPKPDLKVQPKSAPAGRPPGVDKGNPSRDPGQPEPGKRKQSAPGQSEAPAREKPVQPQSPPRGKEPKQEAPNEPQRKSPGQEKKSQPEPERRGKDAAVNVPEAPQRNAPEFVTKAPRESEQRVNGSPPKARDVPPQNPSGLKKATQAQTEPRIKEPAPVAQSQSQGKVKGPERKAQKVSEQPVRRRFDPGEKGAEKLIRKDYKKKTEHPPKP